MVELKSTEKERFKYVNQISAMEVVKMFWDPFDEIAKMHEEMDRLFKKMYRKDTDFLGYGSGKEITKMREGFRAPVCDVKETETGIISAIELPGVDKKDIELNVNDDSIEVKVESKDEKKAEKKGMYSYASRMSKFYRKIPLPKGVQPDKAKASFKNGLLRIEVPKKEQAEKKKKRIEIE